MRFFFKPLLWELPVVYRKCLSITFLICSHLLWTKLMCSQGENSLHMAINIKSNDKQECSRGKLSLYNMNGLTVKTIYTWVTTGPWCDTWLTKINTLWRKPTSYWTLYKNYIFLTIWRFKKRPRLLTFMSFCSTRVDAPISNGPKSFWYILNSLKQCYWYLNTFRGNNY